MQNFDFYNPTHIVFGKDRLEELNNLVPEGAKVLVTYGGGSVRKFGTLEKVLSNLKGRDVLEFGGIEPNPRYETLMKAVDVVKNQGIDFLLAVGGGSVMDGTKFIALASKYEGEASELLYHGFKPVPVKEAVPLGTVVTLPATGSEMNAGGVISYGDGKFPVMSPLSFPKFSILDPTLTYTLPEKQIANGVADTFVHVTEQYLTFPSDGRFQDRTSEGILKTMVEIGRETIDNKEEYDTRANFMWCATMALNGLIGSGVPQDWTTHMIGHELTAHFGIDHGTSLAILLPSVLKYTKEQKKEKLVQYGQRVWGINERGDDLIVDKAIEKTRDFFESLGIDTNLGNYGVAKEDLEKVLKGLEAKGLVALSETGKVTIDISEKILLDALNR